MKRLVTNRVFLGALIFFVAIAVWDFKFKPQYRPLYDQGLALYKEGEFERARRAFQDAYDISPNAVEVVRMLGWANLKIGDFHQARYYFERLQKLDSSDQQGILGMAAVAVETGRGVADIASLEAMHRENPNDADIRAVLAGAYLISGKNKAASDLYVTLVGDSVYGKFAREALDDLYGVKGFEIPIPDGFPALQRPAALQVLYRAGENAMWRRNGAGEWDKYYVAGANLGPGAPGFAPGTPPMDGKTYAEWLAALARMNANVVRVYTLLPPAFYRAFQREVEAGSPLMLYQQIWIDDPPGKDLYDPQFIEHTKAEIRYVVDAIHGQGDVPRKHARGSGFYTVDISQRVAALLLGREVEPSVAVVTNQRHADKTSFSGRYISVSSATATETWFAEMLEYMVQYETDRYSQQRPVAVVNWPPTDPLTHPTEVAIEEEVNIRRARGERLAPVKGPQDDNDVVAIDEAKFRAAPEFQAGLFASYHVYPYYPDFLIQDPRYLGSRDREGSNAMLQYLRDLRAHIPHPLVITEYGIPTSIGISHFHPHGWHHGGHSEAEQAAILGRLTRSIREAGCAGGVVFALIDEWYKQNWLTRDFHTPEERANLWLNEIDPETRYGVIGFRPSKWNLFSGNRDWSNETLIVGEIGTSQGGDANPVLRAAVDEAYLYLQISGVKPNTDYAVALNTLPQKAGIRRMPFGDERIEVGANFLVMVERGETARLLIAENYNPYQTTPRDGVPGETEISYKRGFSPKLDETGRFVEQIIETNRQRYLRDGKVIPAVRYNRSPLRLAAESAPNAVEALGEWFVERKSNTIVLRIPWGKLFVTDPSSHTVFFGFDEQLKVRTEKISSLYLGLYSLNRSASGAPEVVRIGGRAGFTWKPWQKVSPELYYKKSYYALQKEFQAQTHVAVGGVDTGLHHRERRSAANR